MLVTLGSKQLSYGDDFLAFDPIVIGNKKTYQLYVELSLRSGTSLGGYIVIDCTFTSDEGYPAAVPELATLYYKNLPQAILVPPLPLRAKNEPVVFRAKRTSFYGTNTKLPDVLCRMAIDLNESS